MPDGGRRFLTRRWLIPAALVAAAAAVGIGVTIGGGAGERVGAGLPRPASPPPQPAPSPARGPTTGDPPPGFVRFLDDQRRFSIALPGRLESARRDERRRQPARDQGSEAGAAPGRARRIELGGLPGWFYFYSFRDASGRRGTHSHYFLFQGSTLITLVFQALPTDDFRRYATTFDSIAVTFRAATP